MADWNAAQYLKFEDERTRAARDLLARVPPGEYASVVDLGCGPGNSTELLIERFPDSEVTGVDRSPDMLRQARQRLPRVEFVEADIAAWTPTGRERLIFANAVFQWVPDHERVMRRLFEALAPAGVLAIQMPDNTGEPSHAAIADVAASRDWGPALEAAVRQRSALPPVAAYYDLLAPVARRVDIWHAVYNHVLDDVPAIVEWVKGTRLRPCLDALEGAARDEFLAERSLDRSAKPTRRADSVGASEFLAAYTERLAAFYPRRADGKILLRFPRLFIVATR
jgi:trans-aconitate 2-methyltransferase